ncbi:Uncharacterised protein [Mycobacteroides abscessus subsp. massiliense]|nr:Uncharacterised protein [Mycobacteroides abscessus subsp. massiliense]SKZ05795.1 Uncharacterised protein [Mycobacteroides abscessus subsp. massiliense]
MNWDGYDHETTHGWHRFDSRYDPWDEYYEHWRCACGAESVDGVTAVPGT